MTVAHPSLLWFTLVLPVLVAMGSVVRGRRAQRVRRYLEGHPGAEFWPVVPSGPALGAWWRLRTVLLFFSGALLGVTLAGPEMGTRTVPVPLSGQPLILVLDISRSMGVADVPLGRLGAARLAARRVVGAIPSVPVGLVVFAGEAHLVVPPTTDREILFGTLDAAGPDLLTNQGTALNSALVEASSLMGEYGGGVGVLILSDGEVHEAQDESVAAARSILEKGGWVSAICLGTEAGGPVPQTASLARELRIGAVAAETVDGAPLSRARPTVLASLAEVGGGHFARGGDMAGLSELVEWAADWDARQALGVEMKEVPREVWVWFLALAVGGLMLEAALDSASSRKEAAPWS